MTGVFSSKYISGVQVNRAPFVTYFVKTLRPRQDGRHFADNTLRCIFLNGNAFISLKISLKFVPKVWINSIPSLVQMRAWCWPGDRPLSESMMASLLTHICLAWPQWVKKQVWVCRLLQGHLGPPKGRLGPKCLGPHLRDSGTTMFCFYPASIEQPLTLVWIVLHRFLQRTISSYAF